MVLDYLSLKSSHILGYFSYPTGFSHLSLKDCIFYNQYDLTMNISIYVWIFQSNPTL